MTTIANVNTKGGVAKTTSTIMEAAAAVYRGHSVNVVDADHQGSASKWVEQIATENPDLPITLTVANMATLRGLPADKVNIVDTPPGNPALIDRAVAVADFVVIPTSPSLGDIDRVWETLEIIPKGTPAAVLLTQVNPQAVLAKQIREYLEAEGVLVFPEAIPRREHFRKIYGQWPDNDARQMLGYEDVFDKIMEVLS